MPSSTGSLGGGFELALNCTYRTIAGNAGAVGLPEISLGLIPGWGGTWLLPNLIGIDAAVEVIVDAPASGRTLAIRKLVEYGAVDALLAAERFLDESIAWAHRVLQGEEIVARPDVNRDQEHWQMAISAVGTRWTSDCTVRRRRPIEPWTY